MKIRYGVCFGMLVMGLAVVGTPVGRAQSRLEANGASGASGASAASTVSASPAPSTSSPADLDRRVEELEKELADLRTELAARKQTQEATAAAVTATTPVAAAPAQGQENPPAAAPSGPMYYPFTAVSGIYTGDSDKDLGKLLGIKLMDSIKFRGWVDTYYAYNFNRPTPAVVTALSPAIVAPNATIQGRTFDVHSNSFTLSLAELEVEKIPDRGGVGFKFDMAFGDTQNIYNDTILAATGSNSLSLFDKTFQHASVSYLAPIGKGLRLDFGKFVTHIGGETIESIKNANFSHSFFYTYGIPFQDYGLRMHYDFNSKVYSEVYVLNPWNVGFATNRGKTYGYTLSYTPSPKFSVVGNWLGGPQQPDNSGNWRHLGDFQIYINPTPRFRTMTNIDVAHEAKAFSCPVTKNPTGVCDTNWDGVAEVLRYRVGARFDPSVRLEWYRDPDGFTTLVPQNLLGFTATFDYFLGTGENDKILIRPEFRYDHSTAKFFSVRSTPGLTRKFQPTVGLDLVYYF